jgi:hypothetical protein
VKDVTPFLVGDPDRFDSPPPDPLTSRRYAREFNEVKLLGSLTSTARTADQTDMARFWAEGPLIWIRASRDVSAARRLDVADNARLFAMLYLTGADAGIACWADKARWLFWRPVTAIHEAATDGNPATAADPAWLPLVTTPPYPDHPSGLACFAGAFAGTLAEFFGTDRIPFTVTSANSGTPRSFTSFSHALQEAVDARIWSGIHFRTADEDGARIGTRVARYGARHYFGRDWHGHW